MTTFKEELESLINRHSLENDSNTPDFILAQYIQGCLDNFNTTITARDKWYGLNQPDPAEGPDFVGFKMKDILYRDLRIGTHFKTNKDSPTFVKQSEDFEFEQHGQHVTLYAHSLVLVDENPQVK